METNGADKVIVSGVVEAECPETMVEIKIKTLDSQIYTLRVNKCMPVPALKDQIATVTGVLSEQQRLICRGKVLKDDQLLSAYHVEDGHTLHLVVRQPFHSSTSTTTGLMGSESTADHPVDPSNGHNRGNHVAHSLVVGTFNMADQRDGAMPDIGRQIVSAVLSSFGITNTEGVDLREHSMERLNGASSASGMSDSTQPPSEQTAPRAQSDSLHDAFRSPTSVSVGSIPPTVIPDSLTTLFQYLSHIRHEFSTIGRNHNRDVGDINIDGLEGGGHDGASRSGAGQGLPTPESLAGVMQSTRQMLVEQAAGCLSQLAGQLESHSSQNDPSARMDIQTNAIRSGVLLHNLGALLLELGRTIMTLRMGRTPAEAVVNAGPAVFISTSGPNPIMVQPLPFQPGTSFGAIPMGTPGHGISGGIPGSGSGRLPRNIDIRVRRGSSISAANAGQGERAGARQPPVQPDPAISAGPNLAHQPVSGASGSPSFPGESRVRIVPIRTVYAAVPALSRPQSDTAGSAAGLFYPLLARFQHLSSGYANVTRGSQSSGENQPSGPETTQQQTTERAAHQQNLGSNGGAPRREGNGQTVINLSPTDGSSVVSDVNFSADTSGQHLQGDGPQNGQDSTTQITSRFDQLLRTIFPGEQINLSEVNLQARPTGPVMGQTGGNGRDGVASEASGVDMDPGTFFSGLVRQIMPFISQTTPAEAANASSVRAVTAHHNTESDPSTSQTEGETSTEVGNSRRRGDPPSSPSSKRQKTE